MIAALRRLVCRHWYSQRVYRCAEAGYPDVVTKMRLLPPIYTLVEYECERCGRRKPHDGTPEKP